jgi:hypothetical protein
LRRTLSIILDISEGAEFGLPKIPTLKIDPVIYNIRNFSLCFKTKVKYGGTFYLGHTSIISKTGFTHNTILLPGYTTEYF